VAKFHVNPKTGNTGACKAKNNCPFGGESEHYSTQEEARAAYEGSQEKIKKNWEKAYASTRDLEYKIVTGSKHSGDISYASMEDAKEQLLEGVDMAQDEGSDVVGENYYESLNTLQVDLSSAKSDKEFTAAIDNFYGKVSDVDAEIAQEYIPSLEKTNITRNNLDEGQPLDLTLIEVRDDEDNGSSLYQGLESYKEFLEEDLEDDLDEDELDTIRNATSFEEVADFLPNYASSVDIRKRMP
jgi:hypothetical protein